MLSTLIILTVLIFAFMESLFLCETQYIRAK